MDEDVLLLVLVVVISAALFVLAAFGSGDYTLASVITVILVVSWIGAVGEL
jgi:hypothetical protein